jgi:rhamnose utilization protein RhaD (predicted bifunctional aldolase and dehydrogenase)
MALTNPSAPNPSVEAILHGVIPYTFVDHTHADSVVVVTNTANGEDRVKEIYGENMLIVPYVMPGFIMAKTIYEMTRGIDWESLDGMILLNHGVFTFDHDARASYSKMVKIVSKAEKYLKHAGAKGLKGPKVTKSDPLLLAGIRRQVSELWGKPVLSKLDNSPESIAFSNLPNIQSISDRGPLTPDHIIRTKRTPVYFNHDYSKSLKDFKKAYEKYYQKYNNGEQQLDPAPRWGIIPIMGTVSFGPSSKHVQIIEDITTHTKKAIVQA